MAIEFSTSIVKLTLSFNVRCPKCGELQYFSMEDRYPIYTKFFCTCGCKFKYKVLYRRSSTGFDLKLKIKPFKRKRKKKK